MKSNKEGVIIMAHVAKFKKFALGHILRHYERGLGDDGQPVRYNNQSIDLSKSHLNKCLSPKREMNQLNYINSLIARFCQRTRKDMVCLVSVVVTLPKNVKSEHADEFFKATHKALTDMFLDGNEEFCVSSWIHNDEKTPHLHYSFCPVKFDKDKGKYKFCAKDIVNRRNLQRLHPFLEKEVGKVFEKYGYTPQILTGEMSTRKNLPIEKYKEYATLRAQIAQSEKELYAITIRQKEIEKKLRILNLEYEPKKEYLENLKKIYRGNKIKENKNFFTGKTSVTISAELWESQKMLYSDYLAAKHMKLRTEKKITEIQEYLSNLNNTDFEERIQELTEQVEQLEQSNKKLEYSLKQFEIACEYNPALKEEFELSKKWINRKNHPFMDNFQIQT